jgi:hypothetical protein
MPQIEETNQDGRVRKAVSGADGRADLTEDSKE